MSDAPEDASTGETSAALSELQRNLEYARDLVRGGRLLQRLRVGAFDVSDLYRAAWVQAVSAMDHWVHQELYDRALQYATQASVKRPSKYLQIQVPMSLLEDVLHHSDKIEDLFREHLRSQFGHQSFQAPEKLKGAISFISDASLWPGVAARLTHDGLPYDSKSVQDHLSSIVKRRNRIAHETDRDHQLGGTRTPIRDTEAIETIDWLARIAQAIVTVIGPPPVIQPTLDDVVAQPQSKWTRQHIDEAIKALDDHPSTTAIEQLLAHADARQASWRAGTSAEPSGGAYYKVAGKRRSLWSLYLTQERPVITINLSAIRSRDEIQAYSVLKELRKDPALDAALLYDDNTMVRRYPAFELATLGESAETIDTVIRALELAISPSAETPEITGT